MSDVRFSNLDRIAAALRCPPGFHFMNTSLHVNCGLRRNFKKWTCFFLFLPPARTLCLAKPQFSRERGTSTSKAAAAAAAEAAAAAADVRTDGGVSAPVCTRVVPCRAGCCSLRIDLWRGCTRHFSEKAACPTQQLHQNRHIGDVSSCLLPLAEATRRARDRGRAERRDDGNRKTIDGQLD